MVKDPNKPRGKTSSYAFFVQTCREEHKKKHPGTSVNFTEFSKKCSERWKVSWTTSHFVFPGAGQDRRGWGVVDKFKGHLHSSKWQTAAAWNGCCNPSIFLLCFFSIRVCLLRRNRSLRTWPKRIKFVMTVKWKTMCPQKVQKEEKERRTPTPQNAHRMLTIPTIICWHIPLLLYIWSLPSMFVLCVGLRFSSSAQITAPKSRMTIQASLSVTSQRSLA